MLKWLVQRVPDPTLDMVTDDPLATLEFESDKKLRRLKEIYSVNRTNPLYDDHEDRFFNCKMRGQTTLDDRSLSSPPATASNSSGYGSHGTQQGRLLSSHSSSSRPSSSATHDPTTATRPREVFLFGMSDMPSSSSPAQDGPSRHRHQAPSSPQESSSIESEPSWQDQQLHATNDPGSETHHHVVPLVIVQRNARFVRGVDMFGSHPSASNMVDVSTNDAFVAGIHFGDADRQRPMQPQQTAFGQQQRFQQMMSPISETSLEPHFCEDSIVTDALLQMTSLSSYSRPPMQLLTADDEADAGGEEAIVLGDRGLAVRKNEDMDRVIRELTQAVIKSRNVSTLTKAMNNNNSSRPSSIGRRDRLRSSLRALKVLANNHGVSAVRDLWERSGMKTNGRKLLVDSLSDDDDGGTSTSTSSSQRRRRRGGRNKGALLPSRRFPKSNSSSISSTTSSTVWSEYQSPFVGASKSQQQQTDLYTEVYRKSSSSSSTNSSSTASSSAAASAGQQQRDRSRPGWQQRVEDDTSGSEGSQKRVTFSRDVKDNEALNARLVYDRLAGPAAAAKAAGRLGLDRPAGLNKADDVVIDAARLTMYTKYDGNNHWESYYGSNGKFAGDPDKVREGPGRTGNWGGGGGGGEARADYRNIFNSPYFDYRKTHSKPLHSSDPLRLDLPGAKLLRLKSRLSGPPKERQRRFCLYWQSILTLVVLGSVLIVIVTLTVYFTGSSGSSV